MLALLTILRPLLPWLAGLLILGGIWGWGYSRGANSVQHKFDAFVATQREATGKIQAAWDAERISAAKDAFRQAERRVEVFVPLKDRAHALPPALSHIVVPPVARQLLLDAIAAANATQPTGEPAAPVTAVPDTTLAEVTQWGVEAAEWAATCRDRVGAWESWYRSLQEAQAAAASSE